jgi:23S rRNA (adenine2030-N6)-methyltransferase
VNYRHSFHAGNFGDVMKHVVQLQLFRALQNKEKGFLYLDTHAGRGSYDLAAAAVGDSLARTPEWPNGIGRLCATDESLPGLLAEYVALVRQFDRQQGNLTEPIRFFPGSPALARLLRRPVERLALCEQQPGEYAALQREFAGARRVSVHPTDGYAAVRAMLPPPERRALVLIDPPFEAADEFRRMVAAVSEGLERHPAAVFALWYPLTERARVSEFFGQLQALPLPPTVVLELAVAGEQAVQKMKGSGLVVINPPWQFGAAAEPVLRCLSRLLAQTPGGGHRIEWLVPER